MLSLSQISSSLIINVIDPTALAAGLGELMFDRHRHIVEARKALGSDVASAFLPAEAAAITAAAQISSCAGILIERHSAAALKPSTGASVIDLVAEGARLAIASRAKMIEAHEQLARLTEELDFLEYVVPECPPNEAFLGVRERASA